MAAGAVLKGIINLGLFSVAIVLIYIFRAFAGYLGDTLYTALGISVSSLPVEQQNFLAVLDKSLFYLPVMGFLAIILAIAVEIYRRSTEGQQYILGE